MQKQKQNKGMVKFGSKLAILCILSILVLPFRNVLGEEEGMPRIACVIGKNPYFEAQLAMDHQFDVLESKLNWKPDIWRVESLAQLGERLDDYDMVVFGREHNTFIKSNFGPLIEPIKKFLVSGGIVVVDSVKPEADEEWISEVQSLWTTKSEKEKLPEDLFDSSSPLTMAPNKLWKKKEFNEIENPLKINDWQILKTNASGDVELAEYLIGDGVIIVNRNPSSEKLLENIWARRVFKDAGLTLTKIDLPELLVGENIVCMEFEEIPQGARFEYRVSVFRNNSEVASADGSPSTSGADGRLSFPVKIPPAGSSKVRLEITKDGKAAFKHNAEKITPPLLTTSLSKNRIYPGDKLDGLLLVRGKDEEEFKIQWSILEGEEIVSRGDGAVKAQTSLDGEPERISLNAQTLKSGAYSWTVSLYDGAGVLIETHSEPFLVESSVVNHRVVIRDDGVMLVNGREHFPIGIYRVPASDLPVLRDTPIDTVLEVSQLPHQGIRPESEEQQNLVAEFGLNYLTMVNWYFTGPFQKDPGEIFGKQLRKTLPMLAKHEGNLAVYLADEPPPSLIGDLSRGYKVLKEVCPELPVVVTLHRPIEDFDAFKDIGKFCDILNVDRYPWPYKKPQEVAEALDYGRKILGDRGALWSTLQTFRFSTREDAEKINEYPPVEWLSSTMYLSLTHGAKGLICFAYEFLEDGKLSEANPEYWKKLLSVLGEARALESVWTAEESVVGGEYNESGLHWYTAKTNEGSFLVVVNGTQTSLSTRFYVPETMRREVDVVFEERKIIPDAGGLIKDTFDPLARRVYKVDSSRLWEPKFKIINR